MPKFSPVCVSRLKAISPDLLEGEDQRCGGGNEGDARAGLFGGLELTWG